MKPVFNDEQIMLRESLSRYLAASYGFDDRQALIKSGAAWSKQSWSDLTEMGVPLVAFSEAHDGLGGTIMDLVAVAELLGAHTTLEPFSVSIAALGRMLSECRNTLVADDLIEKMQSGNFVAALAYDEGNGIGSPDLINTIAEPFEGGFKLSGEKRCVLHGDKADALFVVARISDHSSDYPGFCILQVSPDDAGVSLNRFRMLDGRMAANVTFRGVEIGSANVLSSDESTYLLIQKMLDTAIVCLCAESVGAMGELMERTGEYASTRKQFGKPIGTFQAIRHRLADMHMNYHKVRSTLMCTAHAMDSGPYTPSEVSILKSQTGRLGQRIAESAVQIHGGIGTTDELSVGHLLKRILVANFLFGGLEHHAKIVGAHAVELAR